MYSAWIRLYQWKKVLIATPTTSNCAHDLGMDMTLAVIAKLCGRATSLQIASQAEYQWHEDRSSDPFAQTAVPQ